MLPFAAVRCADLRALDCTTATTDRLGLTVPCGSFSELEPTGVLFKTIQGKLGLKRRGPEPDPAATGQDRVILAG
jgi:hypothetical protein